MIRIVALVLVVAVMALTVGLAEEATSLPGARATLTFGFLLLAAYLAGDVLSRLRLPKITGYILAGIVFGPHALELVTDSTVSDLKLIDDLALTFIALAAGGELRVADLRRRGRAILLTVLFLTVVVFTGVCGFTIAARPLFSFLGGRPFVEVFAVAALLGTFAVARSPSSAIAIITECDAKGPFTELVLGVTVVMDVLVILVFATVVSVCLALTSPAGGLDVRFLLFVVLELAGSIMAGVVLGILMSVYLAKVKADRAIFILAAAFLVTFVSRQFALWLDRRFDIHFHLEPMLICLTAGFLIRNYSREGETFMERIDRSSLPIYVIFFSLTGAALDVTALEDTWLVAVLLVCARALLIWIGAWIGAFLSGDPPLFRRLSGLSFVTQAGVSLGLAGIVMRRFPEWGADLATVIVAVITLNQVIGPIGFRYALSRAGEDREGRAAATPPEA